MSLVERPEIDASLPEKTQRALFAILSAIAFEQYDRAEAFTRLALRGDNIQNHSHVLKAITEARRIRKRRVVEIHRGQ